MSTGWTVSRVVDGDTIHVVRSGTDLTIRLLGIDTPETVYPGEPVQCFGPQASTFATRMLTGKRVLLEFDPSQGRLDRYGRTLAYVWLRQPKLQLFDLTAIRRGFALEYTYDQPYAWRGRFLAAESAARRGAVGLWSPRTCGGDVTQPAR